MLQPPSACPKDGCLFNVVQDPYERNDLSKSHADVKAQLTERLKVGRAPGETLT